MQSSNAATYSNTLEEYIERIKSGENDLRESMIKENWKYIISVVSKLTGKSAESTDEFSVGLQAFNEAIDNYDKQKNDKFLPFASLVINRRVIDYIRKNMKFEKEYPFTFFEVDNQEEKIKKHFTDKKEDFTKKIEVEEEIIGFKKQLAEFGIEMDEMVKFAPKHIDTKIMCVSIAKRISSDPNISKKIMGEKKLAINYIVDNFIVKRKTVEKHRKYILVLFLVFNSNLEVIKGYSDFLLKGVNK